MGIVSYAQNFEDVMLWRALSSVESGFYVDIGAQDPISDSVSQAFYEHGWRGVHVEPSPAYADRLRNARPDEDTVQAVMGSSSGVIDFFEIPETGLSTADTGVAEFHREAGHVVRAVSVISMTLDQLLHRYIGRQIHWLKIDVEGHEREVLGGWKAKGGPQPWIVVIESTYPTTKQERHAEWEQLLLARGYEFAYFDGLNRFYVSNEHRDLHAAFSAPPNVFDQFVLSGTSSASFAVALADQVKSLTAREAGLVDALRALRSDAETIQTQVDTTTTALDQAVLAQTAARSANARLSSELDESKKSELGLRQELTLERQTVRESQKALSNALEGFAELKCQLTEMSALHSISVAGLVPAFRLELDGLRQRENSIAMENASALAHERELADRRERAITVELQREIDAARELDAHTQVQLGAIRAVYHSIESSRSWRYTLPLRLLGLGVRRIGAVSVKFTSCLLAVPRRLFARALRTGLRGVRSSPDFKRRAGVLLAPFPRLDYRLRRFARANPQSLVLPKKIIGALPVPQQQASGCALPTSDNGRPSSTPAASKLIAGMPGFYSAIPRQVARRLLLAGWSQLKSRPHLRARVVHLLMEYPKVDVRIRHLARAGNADLVPPNTYAQSEARSSVPKTMQGETDADKLWPRSMKESHQKLVNARRRFERLAIHPASQSRNAD